MAFVICRARLTNGAERPWLNTRKTMALLVDEEKLRNLLYQFADDAYESLHGIYERELNSLIEDFIEECKKTSPAP
jgi:hypothetical protein